MEKLSATISRSYTLDHPKNTCTEGVSCLERKQWVLWLNGIVHYEIIITVKVKSRHRNVPVITFYATAEETSAETKNDFYKDAINRVPE